MSESERSEQPQRARRRRSSRPQGPGAQARGGSGGSSGSDQASTGGTSTSGSGASGGGGTGRHPEQRSHQGNGNGSGNVSGSEGRSSRGRRRRGGRGRRGRGGGDSTLTAPAQQRRPDNTAGATAADPEHGAPRPARTGAESRKRSGSAQKNGSQPGRGAQSGRGSQPGRGGGRKGQPAAPGGSGGNRRRRGDNRSPARGDRRGQSGPRLRTVRETSAGGLVLRGLEQCLDAGETVDENRLEVALIGRLDRRGRMLWSMPKGHIEDGETQAETARREVSEETGVNGTVLAKLGVIEYWFVADGRRIHKTVHHHLIRFDDGELCDEDPEITEVAWVPLPTLADRLAYPDERRLVDTSRDLIRKFALAERDGRNPAPKPAEPVDPARRAPRDGGARESQP